MSSKLKLMKAIGTYISTPKAVDLRDEPYE